MKPLLEKGYKSHVPDPATPIIIPSMLTPTYRAVLSPCVGICSLDDDGLCLGCHRTSAEIARWPQMNDDERLRLMETTLAVRESQRS